MARPPARDQGPPPVDGLVAVRPQHATREDDMRYYEFVSGALFGLIALAQLTRSILGLPARVGSMAIPVWWSVVAFLVTGSLALWAFRASRGAA